MAENRLPAPDPGAQLRVSSCPGKCQKSSRKLGKPPFSGKSFYLDLPAGKNLQFLTEAIQKLGGVIEGFLSKEVSYIVSSRREAKAESGGTNHSSYPCPSEAGREPFSMDDARGTHTKTSQKRTPLVPLSRGKELLQKAIRNQKSSSGGHGESSSSSFLSSARSWGVRVLHVDDMMKHVQQLSLSSSYVKKQDPKKPQGTRPGTESRTRKVVRLKAPFIKIEDGSRKFRPSHHQFKSFPEISFLGPKDASPFEAPTTPSRSHHTRELKDLEPGLQSGVRTTPRKRTGFCECCQVAFTELHVHLQSAQHQSFALEANPYAEVDRIIAQFNLCFADIPPQASLPRQSGSLDSETLPSSQLSHPNTVCPGMKKEDGGQGPGTPEQNKTVDNMNTSAGSAGTGEEPGPEVRCQELEGPCDVPVDLPRISASKSPTCQGQLLTSSASMDLSSDPDLALAGHKRKVQFPSGNAEKKAGPSWSHASISVPGPPSSCSAETTGGWDGLSLYLPGCESRPLASPLPLCSSRACLSLPGPFPWQPMDKPAELQTTQPPKSGGRGPLEPKGSEHGAPDPILQQAAQLPSCSPALDQPSAHLHSAAEGPSENWPPRFPTLPASTGGRCSQWIWDAHPLQIACLAVPKTQPSPSAGKKLLL